MCSTNSEDGPLFGDPNCKICNGVGYVKVYGQDIAFVSKDEAEFDIVECECASLNSPSLKVG